jgi:hypothetical protein
MFSFTIGKNKMENENQPEEQVKAPELTIVDLQNIKSIIDVSARRGSFSAGEMEAVGATYNKLSKFLESVAPQAPAETAQP